MLYMDKYIEFDPIVDVVKIDELIKLGEISVDKTQDRTIVSLKSNKDINAPSIEVEVVYKKGRAYFVCPICKQKNKIEEGNPEYKKRGEERRNLYYTYHDVDCLKEYKRWVCLNCNREGILSAQLIFYNLNGEDKVNLLPVKKMQLYPRRSANGSSFKQINFLINKLFISLDIVLTKEQMDTLNSRDWSSTGIYDFMPSYYVHETESSLEDTIKKASGYKSKHLMELSNYLLYRKAIVDRKLIFCAFIASYAVDEKYRDDFQSMLYMASKLFCDRKKEMKDRKKNRAKGRIPDELKLSDRDFLFLKRKEIEKFTLKEIEKAKIS